MDTHSESSHSHSHSSSSSAPTMSMSSMQMVFYTANNTPFLSSAWSPHSTASYAGTCIFLIFLAAIFRALVAGKGLLERRWYDQARGRRYVRVRGAPTEADKIDASNESEYSTLITARGVEEHVKVVTNKARPIMPWRLSVDLPRALYVTVTAGVGYLLYVLLSSPTFLHVLSGVAECWLS